MNAYCATQTRQQPHAELGVGFTERNGCFLEQLHRALVGDPRSRACLLKPECGGRE